MAIKDRILNFIKTNENFTPSQIAEALNLNKNTVRGRLSELRKEFVISKRKITYEKKRTKKEVKILKEEKREIEELKPIEYRRKIIKTTGYSSGKKETLFAITYEANKIDRISKLTDAIFDEFDETHGLPERFFGYDQEETTTNPPFIYPDIEVGSE